MFTQTCRCSVILSTEVNSIMIYRIDVSGAAAKDFIFLPWLLPNCWSILKVHAEGRRPPRVLVIIEVRDSAFFGRDRQKRRRRVARVRARGGGRGRAEAARRPQSTADRAPHVPLHRAAAPRLGTARPRQCIPRYVRLAAETCS